jgi:hypothetical protein
MSINTLHKGDDDDDDDIIIIIIIIIPKNFTVTHFTSLRLQQSKELRT